MQGERGYRMKKIVKIMIAAIVVSVAAPAWAMDPVVQARRLYEINLQKERDFKSFDTQNPDVDAEFAQLVAEVADAQDAFNEKNNILQKYLKPTAGYQ